MLCWLFPELKEMVALLQSTINSMENEFTENTHSMQDMINSMKGEINALRADRLSLYIGNLLVDFISKLYQKQSRHLPGTGNDRLYSTTLYVQATQQNQEP